MRSVPSSRRLDHLVLPARDLDAQATLYQRLGFQVGARNRHPWGTENRLVQFDRCFLELITLGDDATPPAHAPRRFSFGAHVRDWLETKGDGMSMLACATDDATADAEWLDRAGIAAFDPFRFGRKGQRPDGTEIEVAFTLAFATPAIAPDLCFFFCQQHFPENFWNAAFQRHANTATGVRRVVLVRDDPQDAAGFLKSYLGGAPEFDEGRVTIETARGALSVSSARTASADFGDDPVLDAGDDARFAAVVFAVDSLDAAEVALRSGNVPFRWERDRLVVPSREAFGVLLAFEEARETR
jgi:catechol 2,3-dioxygenase-like lactoylglutathione lyase family enzyme